VLIPKLSKNIVGLSCFVIFIYCNLTNFVTYFIYYSLLLFNSNNDSHPLHSIVYFVLNLVLAVDQHLSFLPYCNLVREAYLGLYPTAVLCAAVDEWYVTEEQ
jgi:hypothetical protein